MINIQMIHSCILNPYSLYTPAESAMSKYLLQIHGSAYHPPSNKCFWHIYSDSVHWHQLYNPVQFHFNPVQFHFNPVQFHNVMCSRLTSVLHECSCNAWTARHVTPLHETFCTVALPHCWRIRLFTAWAQSTCRNWSTCACLDSPFAPATVCSWPGLGPGQRPGMLPFQLLQQSCRTVSLPPSGESMTRTLKTDFFNKHYNT